MRVIRILTGLVLAFVVVPINGLTAYSYTFGGSFQAAFSMWGSEAENDPRIVVTETEEGKTKYRPKDTWSNLSLIMSNKYGAFGIFLQLFIWLQFIKGFILLLKQSFGFKVTVFIGVVAIATLMVEIIGAVLTSSFGISNAIGSIVALVLMVITINLHKTRQIISQ